jgi:hypothetical protein
MVKYEVDILDENSEKGKRLEEVISEGVWARP